MNLDVDVVIFIGFLILNLVFGLLLSRGIKTVKSYAVGDSDFSITRLCPNDCVNSHKL